MLTSLFIGSHHFNTYKFVRKFYRFVVNVIKGYAEKIVLYIFLSYLF